MGMIAFIIWCDLCNSGFVVPWSWLFHLLHTRNISNCQLLQKRIQSRFRSIYKINQLIFLSVTSPIYYLQLTVLTITVYGHYRNEATARWAAVAWCRSDHWCSSPLRTISLSSSVVRGWGRPGRQERVPHMRKDVSFSPGVVEVVRDAADGNGFLYPSHLPIRYLF